MVLKKVGDCKHHDLDTRIQEKIIKRKKTIN